MSKQQFNVHVILVLLLSIILLCTSCATSSSTSVKAEKGGSINRSIDNTAPNLKKSIYVQEFSTEMSANNSAAYAKAAQDTIVNMLQASGKFLVFDTASGNTYTQYKLIGSVNSVASKTTGGSFMGLSSQSTSVEASVTIRLVDSETNQVIFAEEGQGTSKNTSAALNVIGISLQSGGYDPNSLEIKAIEAAIDSLINNIIEKCNENPWQSNVIVDNGLMYIFGGESIGIKAGSSFDIYKRGSKITNPLTGEATELPGEKVGEVVVEKTYPGNTPENEISVIKIKSGSFDIQNPNDYVIREQY